MYRCTLPRQAGWVLFHRLLQSLRCAHTRPSPTQGLPHGKGCSKHLCPRFTHAAGASLPQSVCADKPVATREAVWHMQRPKLTHTCGLLEKSRLRDPSNRRAVF